MKSSSSSSSEQSESSISSSQHTVTVPDIKKQTTNWEIFGWISYDFANAVYEGNVLPVLLPLFLTLLAEDAAGSDGRLSFLGDWKIPPSSYYPYIVGISVFCQVVVFLLFGATADFGSLRKILFVVSASIGAIATILFVAVFSNILWFGALLLIISNVGLGMSSIYYNSFLPILVANHPEYATIFTAENNNKEKKSEEKKSEEEKFEEEKSETEKSQNSNTSNQVISEEEKSEEEKSEEEKSETEKSQNSNNSNQEISEEQKLNQNLEEEDENKELNKETESENKEQSQENKIEEQIRFITQKLNGKWSSWATSAGFLSTVFTLILVLILFFLLPPACRPQCEICNPNNINSNLSDKICGSNECPNDYLDEINNCDSFQTAVRINLVLGGIWWLGFSLISFFLLKNRKSHPLPEGHHYIAESLKNLWRTLKKAPKLPNTFIFLAGFWLYSDGAATVTTAAALVLIEELGFDGLQLAILFLIANISGFIGCFVFLFFYRKWPDIFTAKRITLFCVFFAFLVPLYVRIPGLFNYDTEAYIIGAIFGAAVAGLRAFSRVILSRSTPQFHEAEFFSFYELTNRGTSWFGPLVLAIVNDLTDDIRWATFAIFPFLLIGGIILFFMNEEKAVFEAKNYHNLVLLELQTTSELSIEENLKIKTPSSKSSNQSEDSE